MTLTSPILWMIRAYRRWLSPLKGWHCAHGQEHGKTTCSQVGLRIFTKTTNPIKGMLLLQRQFDRCADSAERLNPQWMAPALHNPKPFTRLLADQRGDCDVGGCDGCDAGGCDVPDCGGCETPNLLVLPCSDPNPNSARSCDWSGCCDAPANSCKGDKPSSASAVSTTQSQATQSKIAARRAIRKEQRTERRLSAHEARERRRQERRARQGRQDDDDDSGPVVPWQEKP